MPEQINVRPDLSAYLAGGTHSRNGGVGVRWGLAGENLMGGTPEDYEEAVC